MLKNECFIKNNELIDVEKYVLYTFANNGAAVLSSCKISNLIIFQKKYEVIDGQLIKAIDKVLQTFPVEWEVLWENKQACYLFVYHKEKLLTYLKDIRIKRILTDRAYNIFTSDINEYLCVLKNRFLNYKRKEETFPDELGFFLGYPVADVIQYIVNDGRNYKECGYWKVYYNVEEARKKFRLYDLIRSYALNYVRKYGELTSLLYLYPLDHVTVYV